MQHAGQLASNGVLAISSCHFGIVGMELTLQSVVMVIYPPSLYSHRDAMPGTFGAHVGLSCCAYSMYSAAVRQHVKRHHQVCSISVVI